MITSLHIVRKALICATLLIVAGYDGIGTELRNLAADLCGVGAFLEPPTIARLAKRS